MRMALILLAGALAAADVNHEPARVEEAPVQLGPGKIACYNARSGRWELIIEDGRLNRPNTDKFFYNGKFFAWDYSNPQQGNIVLTPW